MEYLIILAYAAAVYGGLWSVNAIMATRNSIFQDGYKFDFKYFLSGLLKAAILTLAMGFGAFLLIQIPELFRQLGVILDDGLATAISVLGVGASFAGGIITQAKKFRENVNDTVNGEDVKVTLEREHDFEVASFIPTVEDNRDGV